MANCWIVHGTCVCQCVFVVWHHGVQCSTPCFGQNLSHFFYKRFAVNSLRWTKRTPPIPFWTVTAPLWMITLWSHRMTSRHCLLLCAIYHLPIGVKIILKTNAPTWNSPIGVERLAKQKWIEQLSSSGFGTRSGSAVAVRQGVLQLRDLHEDTTGPGQGREGWGDFPVTHRADW